MLARVDDQVGSRLVGDRAIEARQQVVVAVQPSAVRPRRATDEAGGVAGPVDRGLESEGRCRIDVLPAAEGDDGPLRPRTGRLGRPPRIRTALRRPDCVATGGPSLRCRPRREAARPAVRSGWIRCGPVRRRRGDERVGGSRAVRPVPPTSSVTMRPTVREPGSRSALLAVGTWKVSGSASARSRTSRNAASVSASATMPAAPIRRENSCWWLSTCSPSAGSRGTQIGRCPCRRASVMVAGPPWQTTTAAPAMAACRSACGRRAWPSARSGRADVPYWTTTLARSAPPASNHASTQLTSRSKGWWSVPTATRTMGRPPEGGVTAGPPPRRCPGSAAAAPATERRRPS